MVFTRWFRQIQRFDWLLLFVVLVLFVFGLSTIYSVELSRESSDFILVRKQLIAFGIGMTALFVMANLNYLQLRNLGRVIYILGLILLVAVLFFGSHVRGTTGWFVVGGFSFQPVEFMKIALAIQLSRYFGEHARRRFGWREIFGSGLLVAVPVGLIMLQPDLGSAMLLVGMWVVVMFFAGLKFRHTVAMIICAVLISIIGWTVILQPYQKERVRVFIDPTLDPLASGYNITQARIAIGSGQWTGRGLGFGSQSQLKFLPESETDFVFAVIAEELGFVGVTMIFLAMAILFWRLLVLAAQAKDNFTSFLVISVFALFFVQISVNIGVNLAILPTTGVALPFVSYGGSSLLISLTMIGIVQSIAVRLRPGDKHEGSWYNIRAYEHV